MLKYLFSIIALKLISINNNNHVNSGIINRHFGLNTSEIFNGANNSLEEIANTSQFDGKMQNDSLNSTSRNELRSDIHFEINRTTMRSIHFVHLSSVADEQVLNDSVAHSTEDENSFDDIALHNDTDLDGQEAPARRSIPGDRMDDPTSKTIWILVVLALVIGLTVALVFTAVVLRKKRSSSRGSESEDEDEESVAERKVRYPDHLGPASYQESVSLPSLTDGSVSDREIQQITALETPKRASSKSGSSSGSNSP